MPSPEFKDARGIVKKIRIHVGMIPKKNRFCQILTRQCNGLKVECDFFSDILLTSTNIYIKVRKVDCERRPGSICCRDQKRPSLDNLAQLEDEPGDDIEGGQDAGKLVQIASNIHEVVVKPNGEPIKEVNKVENLFK